MFSLRSDYLVYCVRRQTESGDTMKHFWPQHISALLIAISTTFSTSAIADHKDDNDRYYEDSYRYNDDYYEQRDHRNRRHHNRRHHYNDRYDGYSNRYEGRHYEEHIGEERSHRRPYEDPRQHNTRRCYSYKVIAQGGVGGFRTTDNIKAFSRVDRRVHHGKICGKNKVRIELSKTHPNVTTTFIMNGRKIVFAAHEPHEKLINNWYRKYYTVRLPKKRHHRY